MSKLRRFHVDSLAGLKPGDALALPESEVRHFRVLRLSAGGIIEIFDGEGLAASAVIAAVGKDSVRVELISQPLMREDPDAETERRFRLAVAWPKGKRAAVLVQECTELGVQQIIPLRCSRSVVSKDADSAGLVRLRRVAAEAAKQCGRRDVPEILSECTFEQLLSVHASQALTLLLDPGTDEWLHDLLLEQRDDLQERPILLIVGPEGGITPEELRAAEETGILRARISHNVLRVETAAAAAWAIAAAILR